MTPPDVTALRREMKFVFPAGDVGALREILRGNARPVRFGAGAESRVHSLYLDDERLSSFSESLSGVSRRVKVRFRWYDAPTPGDGPLFIEVKAREGTLVRKSRFEVVDVPPLGDAPIDDVLAALGSRLDPRMAAWISVRSRPTLLITYRREHFRDRASAARMTLDHGIVGHDLLGRRRLDPGPPVPVDDLVVVEVKTPPGEERVARRLLFPLRPRLVRCSKYCHCGGRMGWGLLRDLVA